MGGSMISTLPFNAFFLVAFPLFLLSASAELSHNCSQSQFCGHLNISYPFFNHNNWGCGLEFLRCRNGLSPVIDSGVENVDENNIYEVRSIDYSRKILLAHDRRLTRADWLNENDKCKFLFNNFTHMPPFFRFLSAQVMSSNLTLRVCNRHDQDLDKSCTIEALQNEPAPAPAPAPAHAPAPAPRPSSHGSGYDCKLVHLPMDLPPNTIIHWPVDRDSELFNNGFRLRWSLPQQCLQCDKNRTHCRRSIPFHHDKDLLSCFDPKGEGNKTKTKIFGIGIPVGVAAGIISSIFFFFIFYKYRNGHNLRRFHSFSLNKEIEKGSTHYGVPVFSHAELEEATNNFSSANELGDGGFGTVYHGKLRDGRVVAIKRLYHNNNKHIERFMNEIEILTNLRHQNLVTLYGCTSYRSRELLLVYEFIPNGTIADHLHGDRRKVGSLPWSVRMSIAIETARALSYLHASDVIHRDVKTSNILLDNHFHVKVADFGLCRLFPTDATHVSTAPQGTPGYVDPEYHRCYQLTDKSDVYSFGVVLIELISSKPAVDITRHRDEINLANMAMNKIQKGALQELVDPCLGFESDCTRRKIVTLVVELAFRCLQQEKELRPSMEEVLEILVAAGVDQEYKVDNAKVIDDYDNYQ
ncbi:LEAF RUST 10 DISEASE-RESISTANCE LOCUS RECEPTOR-LIKE PROTEIN KINASE-like 1.1 [Macadamia integrifolia]|uniref:LEAF RUST 10 DISEASE-RESISTANCE LOCUS RECEPTOR-LIKE PROTEIN KINASE-like 1.1 n=1 Tax=Macadamia integrifolia TaxID=60698 RepID=UPI001C5317BD|nr:LEAF RUST 10 DISEASE-RESISTANCE LOCUS RECEPTOR-LIKE PROTEIN KINASE-like 1.1 [Macadamia integrifolia]